MPRGASRGTAVAPPGQLALRGRAAGRRDLVLGAGGERVHRHLHGDGQLAGPEDLDRAALANRAALDERLHRDLAALREERAELVEVHDLVLDPERVLEALEL